MSTSDWSNEDDNSNQYQNGEDDNEDQQDEEDQEIEVNSVISESEADQLDCDVIEVDESEYIDECTVNSSHFDFIKKLGSGAYGTVFLVKKNCGIDINKIYALKIIAKEEVVKVPKTIIHMKAERKVLELIRGCPFIPKLYYAFQTADKLFLVIDYIPGGEMFSLLQKATLPEEHVRFYIAELIVALEHIHKHGIVYRDIKLENILIDADGHIKLVDFGLCKKLGPRGRSKSLCGTVEYMAPEVIACTGHNTAADWWAIGVLTIELLTTITPFGAIDNSSDGNAVMNKITNEDPVMPPNITTQMEDFIRKMLIKNPEDRLGGSQVLATDIKQHPLFEDIDWSKLERKQLPAPDKPLITHPYDTQNFSDEFTDQPASFEPSAIPPRPFSTFAGYSYIAPELNLSELPSNHAAMFSNREPNSEFDRKYKFASAQPLGYGKSSVCMTCINLKDGLHYAVKMYKRQVQCDNQIDVLRAAADNKMACVVNLVEVLKDSKCTYLIMERIDGVDFLEYLSTISLNGKNVYKTFDALWKCVKNVHSLKYSHERICFKNIKYIRQSKEFRLIGFTNAKPIVETRDEYLDYWSLGVCLYTVLCGQSPFDTLSNQVIKKIHEGDFNQESQRWTALKKKTKIFVDQLLSSSTPTWNSKVLGCILDESFGSLENLKQQIGVNENIISIRSTRVETDLEIVNGSDTNGKTPIESLQDTALRADTLQENRSAVQESQNNHPNVNGHIPKSRPRRNATPDIKTEPGHENKNRKALSSTENSVALAEKPTQLAEVVTTDASKSERRKRPPKTYKQDVKSKISTTIQTKKKASTSQPENIDVKVEKISPIPKAQDATPKKTVKATNHGRKTQPKVTSPVIPEQTIKRSKRIAIRVEKQIAVKSEKPPSVRTRKRRAKEAEQEHSEPASKRIKKEVRFTSLHIGEPASSTNRFTNQSVQTDQIPSVYQKMFIKTRPTPYYCFERFDYK